MTRAAIATGKELGFEMPDSLRLAFMQSLSANPEGSFVFADEKKASYAQLWDGAQRMLGGLQAAGCTRGDVVIMDAANVENFIPALWAIMLGGMVALPLARSQWNLGAMEEFQGRLNALVQQLGSPVILSNDSQFSAVSARHIAYEKLRAGAPHAPVDEEVNKPAVLIPTSGTTGNAQLVMLSSRAVMHRWWPSAPSAKSSRVFLGWTPLDHVMGLGFAAPNAQKKIYLPPEGFVHNPLRWLELVQEHRVTHSVMTNFGMKLLLDALGQEKHFDLSSICRIGIGAEMISADICNALRNKFLRFGMPEDAFILGYGLSECGPVAGGQQSFVPSQGAVPPMIDLPTAGHAMRITHDAGICNEAEEGRIEVRGPTMTLGYYGDENANRALFTPDGWLRTGDLGYIKDGCICVTGREKETLSINARKFPCNQIDALLSSVPEVAFAHVFAAPGAAQRSRICVAYGPHNPAAEAAMRKRCVQSFGFGISEFIAVAADELPRTSSGKMRRHKLSGLLTDKAAQGQFPGQFLATTLEEKIRAIMMRFLSGVHLDSEDNFFEFGGDSLGVLMLSMAIENEFGASLPPAIVANAPTSRAIAEYIENNADAARKAVLVPVQKGTAGPMLYLAPGVWGNNAYATAFAAEIGKEYGVSTFHLNVPEAPAQRAQTVQDLARECCALVRDKQPEGPYHLVGHSFGGLLAYEMARQLVSEGAAIGSLSIIDVTAKYEERNSDAALGSDEPAFVRHYYRDMMHRYFTRPLDCRIDYYRAKDSIYQPRWGAAGGWEYFAGKGVRVFDIPGDHQTIMQSSSRMQVVQLVRAAICGEEAGVFVPALNVSNEARTWLDEARMAALESRREQEIACYASALALGEVLPYWAYANHCEALFGAGRVPEAVAAYRAALQRTAWKPATYKRFAPTLRTHDLVPLGIEIMNDITPMKIDSVATAFAKAKILSAFGDVPGAIASLKAGLVFSPGSLELRWLLAYSLADLQKPEEAAEQIAMALSHPTDNDVVFLRLGKLALKLGRQTLAEGCLKHSLGINNQESETYYLLGQIAHSKGDIAAATEFAHKAALLQKKIIVS